MRMKKYEITDIAHPDNPKLHRIRALTDVGTDVHKGDLGGFVETEDNLDQEGFAWIGKDAIACEDSYIGGDAILADSAVARDSAYVGNNAVIADHAVVQDNAIVCGGYISGNSCITCARSLQAKQSIRAPARTMPICSTRWQGCATMQISLPTVPTVPEQQGRGVWMK